MKSAEDLCQACGLCCDGTLFDEVKLEVGDDAKRLTDLGNDLMLMNPQEFSRYVDSEISEYDKVIRSAGIEKR